jgi:hypothetical protein
LTNETDSTRNPYLKDLPPERPSKADASAFRAIDLFVRALAGLALIPLAIAVFFVAIMAGDAPKSGILPSLLVLTVGGTIVSLLGLTCVIPDALATKLTWFGKYSRWVVRAPAYLYAPFGIYYGERVISGIWVNL